MEDEREKAQILWSKTNTKCQCSSCAVVKEQIERKGKQTENHTKNKSLVNNKNKKN